MAGGRRWRTFLPFPPPWAPYPVSPALKWAGYFAAGNLAVELSRSAAFPSKDQLVRESHEVLRPVVGWDCKAKDGA